MEDPAVLPKVAVLGLGLMGTAVARRLEEAGADLVVYNRSDDPAQEFVERGVPRAATPREAIERADVCFSMLSDGAAVESVATGDGGLFAGERLAGDRIFVEMSTIDVATSERVARAAAAAGVDYLRAPVSGNPVVVAAGNLTILLSGPEEAFERARPVLLAIGPNLFHVGEGEQARVMKLALNLMIAGTTELLAEALALGEANGLERAAMLEVIGGSVMGSPFVKYKTQPLIEDDYTSTFSAALMAKDLDLILATGRAAGVPLRLAEDVRELVRECVGLGMGDLDFACLVPRLQRQAGLIESLPVNTPTRSAT
jgi:3-hydroxyisobutyrate dehydrogenase-like beta-hydroxyacid dehydrogenase